MVEDESLAKSEDSEELRKAIESMSTMLRDLKELESVNNYRRDHQEDVKINNDIKSNGRNVICSCIDVCT